MNNRKYYILNYIFILGVILLFLNDHIFKYEYSNWITGKLSDVVGLLVFPFFLTFLFPKSIKWNVIITGLFFVFWKSPYSQQLIEFYNSIALIKITRVVDYTDLIALSVLPLTYFILKTRRVLNQFYINKLKAHPLIIVFPAIIVFMATSPPYWHSFMHSEGNIKFFKNKINIKKSQNQILDKLKVLNISAIKDTTNSSGRYIKNSYVINELILDKDTIKDLRFTMVTFKKNKTEVFLNAITISKDLSDDEVKKELNRYYKKLLRKYFRSRLK